MPHTLDCAAIHVLLLPMISGQLTPALNHRVHEHLSYCPACQGEFEEIRTVQRQLSALIEQLPPAPHALWSKIQLATMPEQEPATEPLPLLSACLNLLTAMGVPEWATQPVTRSVNLAQALRVDPLLLFTPFSRATA